MAISLFNTLSRKVEPFQPIEAGKVKEVNVILRADVQGSVDVLMKYLTDLNTDEVEIRILHAAVGGITEGDVVLAEASDAIIIGFNVVPEDATAKAAEANKVDIRLYNVIYRIAEDLTGSRFIEKAVRQQDAEITDRQRAWDFISRREMPTIIPAFKRLSPENPEVETGLSQEQAHEESKRCYLCYLHYEIDMDRCIYCRYCIDVAPRNCIKLVDKVITNDQGAITGYKETSSWSEVNAVIIDNSRCIRCGECVRICPMDCISVTRVELIERPRISKNG